MRNRPHLIDSDNTFIECVAETSVHFKVLSTVIAPNPPRSVCFHTTFEVPEFCRKKNLLAGGGSQISGVRIDSSSKDKSKLLVSEACETMEHAPSVPDTERHTPLDKNQSIQNGP